MKPILEMTKFELTAYIQSALEEQKIHVVLSGGAAVSFYSDNAYVSYDLDLVNLFSVERKRIKQVMESLGFVEEGRYFTYTGTDFFIEFPPGPLTVGVEPVKNVDEVRFVTGTMRIISATDSVKDRLAAFYHWGDEQCLKQARLIKERNKVDLDEIERWSKGEGKQREFLRFISD